MKINHAVKVLIANDFLVNSGFSLFAPIFAIFVTGQIAGGTLATVGFAAAIAQITNSVLQIPIAQFLDRDHGEHDDFISLIAGGVIVAFVPFLYFFADTIRELYVIQFFYGVGAALAIPPWYGLFTRHIDKFHESFDWSVDSALFGVAGATFAAVGGILAERVGFASVFILGGILACMGAVVQLLIFRDLKEKVRRGTTRPSR